MITVAQNPIKDILLEAATSNQKTNNKKKQDSLCNITEANFYGLEAWRMALIDDLIYECAVDIGDHFRRDYPTLSKTDIRDIEKEAVRLMYRYLERIREGGREPTESDVIYDAGREAELYLEIMLLDEGKHRRFYSAERFSEMYEHECIVTSEVITIPKPYLLSREEKYVADLYESLLMSYKAGEDAFAYATSECLTLFQACVDLRLEGYVEDYNRELQKYGLA
ncbi:hypothetical protein [Listeria booriae]|uniref:hypothetical protein n=1 Tax=Listeria booriae TaxID=1552123 RepID=UPI0016260C28|nr:hypothetical protein [Listeria booriae]MBC1358304.1 hypothetical protein [Listeria booriae]